MALKHASCKLSPAEALATLQNLGLVRRSDGFDRPGRQQTTLQRSGVIQTDSRKVGPGDIFLAYRGVTSDGHDHLSAAVNRGAALLVVEDGARMPVGAGVPWIETANGRAAWAWLAARAFGNPQDKLTILGVTGTNGKTSTAWMTGELLKAAGVPCLIVGTLGAFLADSQLPTGHTTPDPDALYGLFAEALDRGVRVVVMEVSSHATTQEKVVPIRFSACAFTSFSRDHLDFHPTMADYYAAKWRLFTELAKPGALMAFADGIEPPPMLRQLDGNTYVYGFCARVRAAAWKAAHAAEISVSSTGFEGTSLALHVDQQSLVGKAPYFAQHALENFAAAMILSRSVLSRWADPETWPRLRPVPGRLEQVVSRGGPAVVVDYAHTPDALEKTLRVVRPLTPGKLVVVFGCGGDRDRGKRPLMGKIAEDHADMVYVTSDNPRSEDPARILADITGGMTRPDGCVIEVDRARAIERAVAASRPGDLILIAGKGHETYQVLKDRTIPFDDREIASKALANKA